MLFSVLCAFARDCFDGCTGSSSYESHAEVAISKGLSQNCSSYAQQSRELRSAFADLELSLQASVPGHTHGVSAAARSSTSAFIDVLGSSQGLRPIYLQGSASDKKKGRIYTRHFRWGKDTNVGPNQVEKGPGDLMAMVDVDYYVDMPSQLARNFRPLMLYTFQPSRAGKADGEYKYRFMRDGKVEYNVAGGGEYTHHVWNWKGDSVGATRNFCGVPLTYSVFSIERKNVDRDHQAILVSPLSKYTGVHAWVAMWRVKTPRLERLNPVDGDFVRISVNGSDGMVSSTARVEGYLASCVDVQVDEAIASAARTTTKLMHATVKSKMAAKLSKTKQGECDFTGSEVLLEYHLRGGPKTNRVDIVDAVRGFQWLKTYQAFEPEKPTMVAFMQPLFNGAFVPNRCRNNDERMVDKRIKELKHKPGAITPIMGQVMDEFVDIFASLVGKLHPVDVEEVYERQNRPSTLR